LSKLFFSAPLSGFIICDLGTKKEQREATLFLRKKQESLFNFTSKLFFDFGAGFDFFDDALVLGADWATTFVICVSSVKSSLFHVPLSDFEMLIDVHNNILVWGYKVITK
jgi:hypothetical protein